MGAENSPHLLPENLSFSKKDYYLTAGETSVSSEQEMISSAQNVATDNNETNSKTAAEIEKSSENFAPEIPEIIDEKTSNLLLKIFARNSQESLTVPDGFKSFLQQHVNDPFLINYLQQENSSIKNPAKLLKPLEPYRSRKDYRSYTNDPFFLFLLYNRFYNNLHYDWQQRNENQNISSVESKKITFKEKIKKRISNLFHPNKESESSLNNSQQQNGHAQSDEQVLRALGKALFDTRDRYESYINSHVDARTGLLNSSTFEGYFTYLQNPNLQEEEVEKEKEERRKKLYGYAVVMIDLDHFKEINDNYGHIVGDHALQKLSEAFINSKEARENDTFFRYGGDEFTLIMPLRSNDQNKMITEELKEAVFRRVLEILHPISQEMQNFPVSKTQVKNLTLSAGVYILPTSEIQTDQDKNLKEIIELIVKQADQALYEAKKTRNSLATTINGKTITFPLTA